ncbi:MAG: hypothetical protein INR69_14885 [Mucilaginibacter polytrichastri]|nr:hypothetical protein [Mucilaginibacter polytrichastri]
MAIKAKEQAVVDLVINGEQAKTSLREVTGAYNSLRAQLSKMKATDPGFADMKRQADALLPVMQQMKQELFGVQKETNSMWKEIAAGTAIGGLAAGGIQGVLEGVIGKAGEVIGKIKDAYAEAEKFRAILTNALGDEKMAGKSLEMLQEFAAKTPFQLNELTDGFIKLVNRGFIPTQEELVKMGDLTASQGKSMDQYVEALLDAQTGEFERLKEFGIRAHKNGDIVQLSFKGITKEVKNTEDAIRGALMQFGEMPGVAGSMESVSKTVVGLASNIEDTWDQIYMKIGQKSEGFIKGFYQNYGAALDFLNDKVLNTDTTLQKLTKTYDEQNEAVDALQKNTVPLLQRHDQLKAKGNLNKQEQAELKTTIDQLAQAVPLAVTEFDKYGNALGINGEKVRQFVKDQQALLEYTNKELIAEQRKQLQSLEAQQSMAQKVLNQRRVVKFDSRGNLTEDREMTAAEVLDAQKKVQALAKDVKGAQELIKHLTGQSLETPAAEVKKAVAIVDMTIGELKEKLKELNGALDKTKRGSADYKRITAEIAQVEKLVSGVKGDRTAGAKAESTAAKLKHELEALQEVYNKLATEAKASTIGELDKQLAEIDNKFNSVIGKLNKLAGKTGISAVDKKKLIDQAENLGDLRDQSKEKATKTYVAKHRDMYKPTADAFDGAVEKTINDGFRDQSTADTDQQVTDLMVADTEERRLQIKAEYQTRELEMEMAHLEAIKEYREAVGKLTTDIDAQIADQRVKIREDELTTKLAQEERERVMLQARFDFAREITNGLNSLVSLVLGKSKAAVAAQKAIALAQIGIDTAESISATIKAASKTSLTPIDRAIQIGVGIGQVLGAMAKARAVLSSANEGSTGGDQPRQPVQGRRYAKGGMLPEGPSHAQGGLKLVDPDGNIQGEVEGGEPIYSKATYRNNRAIMNQLLFNSMYKNGAALGVNSSGIAAGARADRNGFSGRSAAPVINVEGHTLNADNSAVEGKLDQVIGVLREVNGRPIEFNYRVFEEYQENNVKMIRNATDA